MESIFNYTNYRTYLRDYYNEKKKITHYFSFRYFAKKAGSGSPSWLKFVIDGKRNISMASIERFIPALELKKREASYFRELVLFNQAKTEKERSKYFTRLMKTVPADKFKLVKPSQHEFYRKWYYSAIREMVNLKTFKEEPHWIAAKLKPMVKPSDVKRALLILKNLGLVKYDKDGCLTQGDPILTSGDDVSGFAVREFHRQAMDLGKASMENFHHTSRELSSLTLSIPKKYAKEIQTRIRAFEEEMLEMVAKNTDEVETVYQLNYQFFPLIESSKENQQ
jgi:uncharacterized protein (TIGR02147 family)